MTKLFSNFPRVVAAMVVCIVLTLLVAAAFDTWFDSERFVLDYWKDLLEAVFTFFQAVAILIAGWWTWHLFVKKRMDFPQAKTELQISHRALSDTEIYLSVTVVLTNTGNVVIKPTLGEVHVRQVVPVLPKWVSESTGKITPELTQGIEFAWPELDYKPREWPERTCVVEPGETEIFAFDFLLKASVEYIRVVSYFTVQPYADVGWRQTAFYDLKRPSASDRKEEMN